MRRNPVRRDAALPLARLGEQQCDARPSRAVTTGPDRLSRENVREPRAVDLPGLRPDRALCEGDQPGSGSRYSARGCRTRVEDRRRLPPAARTDDDRGRSWAALPERPGAEESARDRPHARRRRGGPGPRGATASRSTTATCGPSGRSRPTRAQLLIVVEEGEPDAGADAGAGHLAADLHSGAIVSRGGNGRWWRAVRGRRQPARGRESVRP